MFHIWEQNEKSNLHIPPQSASAAVNGASWLPMKDYGIIAFLCGAAASASNVVCQVYQATDSSGTGAKTMTNGPQSGTVTLTGDGSTAQEDVIECTDRDLDVANGFDYVRLTMTPSGTTTICAHSVRGNCRYKQATMPS